MRHEDIYSGDNKVGDEEVYQFVAHLILTHFFVANL